MLISRRTLIQTGIALAASGYASVALAEKGGQCVRYVKNRKPGGYDWDKYYSKKKNGKPLAMTCGKKEVSSRTCVQWIPAKDIWEELYTQDRGSEPKVDSVMVFGAFNASPVGHVAIVTGISGSKLSVIHSNWDGKEIVSTGTFTLIGGGKARYTTSKGVTSSGKKNEVPVLGYIYRP